MSSQESTSHLAETTDTVSAVANYIFWSFNFSQGSVFLQDTIISFGRHEYADQIANLDEAAKDAILTQTFDRTLHFFQGKLHSNLHLSDNEACDVVFDSVDTYTDLIFNLKNTALPEDFASEVARYVVNNDNKYLQRSGGRDKSAPATDQPIRDPFLSQTWHYVLLANETPHPVITKLFSTVRPVLLEMFAPTVPGTTEVTPQNNTDEYSFIHVTDVYLLHHPELAFSMETALPGIIEHVAKQRYNPHAQKHAALQSGWRTAIL